MKFLVWAGVGFALMASSILYEYYEEAYQYSDWSPLAGLIFVVGFWIVLVTFCKFVKHLVMG